MLKIRVLRDKPCRQRSRIEQVEQSSAICSIASVDRFPPRSSTGPETCIVKRFGSDRLGFYRHFYRQNSSSFAGAGDGAIRAASTLSTLSSIRRHLSALELALERPALHLLTATSHRVFWPPAQARPGWHRGHAVRSPVAIRLALRQWPLVYEQEVLRRSARRSMRSQLSARCC